ncbi:MAG: 50S ribosomal protein L25 [Planctomycetota bacterium]
MSTMHTYEAESRTALGTTAAKKIRATGKVPLTINKRGAPSKHLTISKDQAQHLKSHVVHLCKVKIGTTEVTTLRGDIAVHCLEDYIQHIDLQEVDAASEIVVDVAVRAKADNCPGVKSGGIVEQRLRMVKVRCPASAIPDHVEISLDAVEVQETVYAKSLPMPKGVTMVTKADVPVLSIVIPRWMKKADETTATTADGTAVPAAAAAGAEGAKAADGAKPAAGDAKAADPKAAAAKPAAGKPTDAKKK